MANTCKICKYFKLLNTKTNEGIGECKRHAPSPYQLKLEDSDDDMVATVWPVLAAEEWCGEFQRKLQG